MTDDTLRAGTAGCTAIMLIFLAAYFYLLMYLPATRRRDTARRRLAIQLHGEVAFVTCSLLIVYLGVRLACGSSCRDAAYFMFGSVIIEASGFLFAVTRFRNPIKRKYDYLNISGLAIGGLAMFVPGLFWMCGASRPRLFELLTMGLALSVVASAEVWFLCVNNWRLVPHRPR